MDKIDIKIPTSKEDMSEIRKLVRQELSDDDLAFVAGGNDDLKSKVSIPWTCHFCGATIMCKAIQDAAKHMTKCPNNPYK